MTIRLRIISDEDEGFFRDIEIHGNCSFLDLNNFIQSSFGYDKGEMTSFFITDNDWNKETEITLMDMALEDNSETYTMADTVLKDLINEPKQRLLYAFDLFSEKYLFIEVYEISNDLCLVPRIVNGAGDPPKAVNIEEMLGDVNDEDAFDMDSFDKEFGDIDDDSDDDSFISYSDNLEDL